MNRMDVFKNRPRREILLGGGALAGVYFLLKTNQLGLWAIDLAFLIIALLLWLGRGRRSLFALSVGIVVFILTERQTPWIGALLQGLAGLTLFYVAGRPPTPTGPWAQRLARTPSWVRSGVKIIATVLVFVGIVYALMGPVKYMVNPQQRHTHLLSVASPPPPASTLTDPLALRLAHHVTVLTQDIGERAIYQFSSTEKARSYIEDQFRNMGGHPARKPYDLKGTFGTRVPHQQQNIELEFSPPKKGRNLWVVGAHFDSAPGTPGADDNASAVAVLLELGRLLMDRPPAVPLRLVAFGTEEPPSFGTRNMGSAQYALSLQKEGIPLAGMVSLEMLGYYNPRPKSQLYPPVLDRYYPDTGTFVSLVSNFNSRGLLKPFKNNWPKNTAVPLETLVLPGPLSSLALSDQLNFWDAGFPAVMLSDTAYFRNPHYHMSSDTADTLDYDKMADVTRTLSAVLSNLPAESPQ